MNDNEITTASLLTGFAIIGDRTQWPGILAGKFDFYMKIVVFNATNERLPSEDEIASTETEIALNGFKDSMRNNIQNTINGLSNKTDFELKIEKERKCIENASKLMKESNKQHAMGSVKEIAKKFNVSIGKVRQLKKENKLHELE